MLKRILITIFHRIEASRPAGYVRIEGLLQFFGSVITLIKQNLPPQYLHTLKEFMVSRLNPLKALCMTSVPNGVRGGEFAYRC